MRKIIAVLISLVFSSCLLQAQQIEDWEKFNNLSLYRSEKLISVDSNNFGFVGFFDSSVQGIFLTSDGGNNFSNSFVTVPKDTHKLSIIDWCYINEKTIFVLADSTIQLGYDGLNPIIDYKANVIKSINGGKTWEKIPIEQEWCSRTSKVISMRDSMVGVMFRFPSKYNIDETTDKIYITYDGWKSRQAINVHPQLMGTYQGYCGNSKIVARTIANSIFITSDCGNNWVKKDFPAEFKTFGNSQDGFIIHNDSTYFFYGNKLINSTQGYHTIVSKTTNSGDKWTNIFDTTDFDTQVVNLSFINDSTLYIHGPKTRKTYDNGKSWVEISNIYYRNFESGINKIIEFSDNNKICLAGGQLFKYKGNMTLAPPHFVTPVTSLKLPLDFELEWTAITGATKYHLQIVEQEGIDFGDVRPPATFDTVLFVNDSFLTVTKYKLTGTSNFKEYTCRIRAINDSQTSPWLSKEFTTDKANDINESKDEFISVIYPNPVSNSACVGFNLASAGMTKLSIVNQLGEELANLSNEWMETGVHNINFQIDRNVLTNGIYFLKIQTGNNIRIQKFVIAE